MRLALLLLLGCLAACQSSPAVDGRRCALQPDQVCVHMGRYEPTVDELQSLGYAADALQSIHGFTFDERGWRQRWGVAFEHQGIPLRLEQSSEWVAPDGETTAVFTVARAAQPERWELEIQVRRPRLGVQFQGRTLLVPRQELYLFSIPPQRSAERAWVWFLALHGSVLDEAPDVPPCCRPESAQLDASSLKR
jgi:hypothetical protein